jgi:hypothetical protein
VSEYQYYEFLAIDCPLDADARAALRDLSSRARITATSFTNSYQWGDFKGDPVALMTRWFDLHLYAANWGTRRLMIRLPARLVDRDRMAAILASLEDVTLLDAGEHAILDISRQEVEADEADDDSGWLASLAPLRAELLAGDLRLLYLLWLIAVEAEAVADDAPEPLPGLGPLTAPLEAFAEYFAINPDLVAAAAERPASSAAPDPAAVRAAIAALDPAETTDLLARAYAGDLHVGVALRHALRDRLPRPDDGPAPRTAAALRERAEDIRRAAEEAAAARQEEEGRRAAALAERARRIRVGLLAKRGEAAWDALEAEIERRNAAGYDAAAVMLADLRALAAERDALAGFATRLADIRARHARKGQFIARLAALD